MYLHNCNLREIPIKFNRVERDFICSWNFLTSLDNSPRYVGGDFVCSRNRLTDLKGGPKEVVENYDCSSCLLTSIEGVPTKGGKWATLIAYDNQLDSLKGFDKLVNYRLIGIMENPIADKIIDMISEINGGKEFYPSDLIFIIKDMIEENIIDSNGNIDKVKLSKMKFD